MTFTINEYTLLLQALEKWEDKIVNEFTRIPSSDSNLNRTEKALYNSWKKVHDLKVKIETAKL